LADQKLVKLLVLEKETNGTIVSYNGQFSPEAASDIVKSNLVSRIEPFTKTEAFQRMVIKSPFWGTERISSCDDKTNFTNNDASNKYVYKVPSSEGEGVYIYVVEGNFMNNDIEPERLMWGGTLKVKLGSVLASTVEIDPIKNPNKLPKLDPEAHRDPASIRAPEITNDRIEPFADFTGSHEEAHGTYASNIAAGKTFGAAPKATVVPIVRISGPAVNGGLKLAFESILKHHKSVSNKFEKNPIAIVSLSQGGNIETNVNYYEALESIIAKGILVVCAAGNDEQETTSEHRLLVKKLVDAVKAERKAGADLLNEYPDTKTIIEIQNEIKKANVTLPGAFPGVLNVGSTTTKGDVELHVHGSGVDIYAPGFEIPTITGSKGEISNKTTSGTSFAAPIVAGSIACLLSEREKMKLPRLLPAKIIQLVKNSARHNKCWVDKPENQNTGNLVGGANQPGNVDISVKSDQAIKDERADVKAKLIDRKPLADTKKETNEVKPKPKLVHKRRDSTGASVGIEGTLADIKKETNEDKPKPGHKRGDSTSAILGRKGTEAKEHVDKKTEMNDYLFFVNKELDEASLLPKKNWVYSRVSTLI